VLPANRPDADVFAKLKNARRVVVFAFVGDQTAAWRQTLGINSTNGVARKNSWVVVFQPFPPDLPNSERARFLAGWLLKGTVIPAGLQRTLQLRWQGWHQSLKQKQKQWLQEISSRPFRDLERQKEAINLLQRPVAEISFTLTSDGSVWLKRLEQLLSDHERIHKALAISLEPREGEICGVWLHTYAPTTGKR
jgi:hypothetical protein